MNKDLYRTEIDVLRAIAIILVVIYHLDLGFLYGGFIGVDIFFVISGYLITKQILQNYSSKDFLINFYLRRARRLLPALILMLLSIFILGYIFFFNNEFQHLNRHIYGGSFFISNFILFQEVGYFDNDAINKPLLHLWSLAIEEQFYLFWPLAIMIIYYFRLNIFIITIVIIILSFGINYFIADSAFKFYFLHTRAWEIFVGSLVAQIELNKINLLKLNSDDYLSKFIKKLSTLVGLTLIILPAFILKEQTEYNHWILIMPVIGTSIILLNNKNNEYYSNKLLSNKILIYIGLISYSLYLWHWPLISVSHLFIGSDLQFNHKIYVIIISIILSSATFHFAEQPIRKSANQLQTIFIILILVFFGLTNFINSKSNILKFTLTEKNISNISDSIEIAKRDNCFEIEYAYKNVENWFCDLGDKKSKSKIFIAGDSHAQALIPLFETLGMENDILFSFAGTSGCPHLLGVQSERGLNNITLYNCEKLNEKIFNYISDNDFDTIIMIGRWGYYTPCFIKCETNRLQFTGEGLNTAESFKRGLLKTINDYSNINVKTVFIHDNPQQFYGPSEILSNIRFKILFRDHNLNEIGNLINTQSVDIVSYNKDREAILNILKEIENKNFYQISVDGFFCGKAVCKVFEKGNFLYGDDDHLSIYGALKLKEYIEKPLLKILK